MQEIIDRKLYDTQAADLVADNKFWDGHNYDRCGRSTSLFKTRNGAFFIYNESRWIGEMNTIIALSIEDAKNEFERLSENYMTWEEAFGEEIEKA